MWLIRTTTTTLRPREERRMGEYHAEHIYSGTGRVSTFDLDKCVNPRARARLRRDFGSVRESREVEFEQEVNTQERTV